MHARHPLPQHTSQQVRCHPLIIFPLSWAERCPPSLAAMGREERICHEGRRGDRRRQHASWSELRRSSSTKLEGEHATHSFPRLALVLHGRREERVRCRAEERLGVDFILPGVPGHPPVHHLHRIGAHRGNERAGKSCGARRFLRIGCGAKRCEIEAVGL